MYMCSILCKTCEYLRTQGAALKLMQVHRSARKRRCLATLCLPIRVAGRSSTFYSELSAFGVEPKGMWLHTLLLYGFLPLRSCCFLLM